jgi:hypothetical protein
MRGLGWDPSQSKVWTITLSEFVISLSAREFAEPKSFNEIKGPRAKYKKNKFI